MTSTVFVEMALIGSLLNDSTMRQDVPWLSAGDFTNPLCQAIWRHLESGNPPQCQPMTDLVELSETLDRDHDLHAMLRGPAELATLQVQAPHKPAVVDYGRILVEATIRREIAAMGLRLQDLATREPELIIDGVDKTLAALEGMDKRRQESTGHSGQVDCEPHSLRSPVAVDAPPELTSSTSQVSAIAPDALDQQLAERAVLGAAIHDRPIGARAQVLRATRADDFTDLRARATWRAVEHLGEHGAVIDEVTVAWQGLTTRHRFGDVLTIQELRETRAAALFHEAAAVTLARSTLTRVASRAGAATAQSAQDLGIDLATVIDSVISHHIAVVAATRHLAGEDVAATIARRNRREADPRRMLLQA